jgi:large subunit ribosomal protein L46
MGTTIAACLKTTTIIVRRPLIKPSLNAFESAYYQYHEQLRSNSSRLVATEFWTRKGGVAGQSDVPKDQGIPKTTNNEESDGNLKSLDRKPADHLYLILQKGKQWGFIDGLADQKEPLHLVCYFLQLHFVSWIENAIVIDLNLFFCGELKPIRT